MAIPVKFYSVTHEEFQKLQEKWNQEKEQSEREGKQVPEEDGGIYFVSDENEIHKA